jgi:DNA-binding MarR family transcriptional regulator
VPELVSLEPNPGHQRSPLVTLTEEGSRVTDDLFQRSEASRATLLDLTGLSADELREARRVIRALLTAFDGREATPAARSPL